MYSRMASGEGGDVESEGEVGVGLEEAVVGDGVGAVVREREWRWWDRTVAKAAITGSLIILEESVSVMVKERGGVLHTNISQYHHEVSLTRDSTTAPHTHKPCALSAPPIDSAPPWRTD